MTMHDYIVIYIKGIGEKTMRKGIYKVLSFAFAMMLVFSAMVFAEDGAVVSIDGKTVEAGEEFELTISFSNCGEIKAFQLSEFNFGEQIELTDATPMVKGAAINAYQRGKYLVAFEKNTECNGEVLKLSLKVKDDAVTEEISTEFKAVLKKMVEDNEETVDANVVAEKIIINGLTPEEIISEEDEEVQEIIPEKGNDKVPEIKPEPEKEDVVGETPEKEEALTSTKRGEDVICLRIDTPLAYVRGKYLGIDEANSKVVPYIVNDRTLVPLRFVSENLGAEVLWEDGWEYCYVNKGDKKIKITFGSADIEVNGKVVTYEAPVEVVEDRTMVPIRFISEELGYYVYWNEANSAVAITPVENPWVESRKAENDLLLDILVTYMMKGVL